MPLDAYLSIFDLINSCVPLLLNIIRMERLIVSQLWNHESLYLNHRSCSSILLLFNWNWRESWWGLLPICLHYKPPQTSKAHLIRRWVSQHISQHTNATLKNVSMLIQKNSKYKNDIAHIYDESSKHLITNPYNILVWLWNKYNRILHQPHD